MERLPLRTTLLALALSTAWPAWADDSTRVKDLEQKLEASLKALDALQRRVDALEHKPAAPAPGEWGARLDNVERAVSQVEAASTAAAQADTGLPIHGFVDVGLGLRNRAAAATDARGARLGVFDLYMAPQISSRVKGLIELAFEYGNGTLATDAERLQLGYVFSDTLTLWGGRFHTPYGYWNTAFHHGAQIQTALSRPRFLAFEDGGGILPAHSVGLWATGAANSGVGKFGYDLYVVNGDRISAGVLDYQASGDADGNIGAGFRSSLAVAGTGFTVGLHGLTQRVGGENAALTATGTAKLAVLGGYATYDNDDWELMAEYYGFRNRDLGSSAGQRFSSKAWYVQAGYNLNDQFTLYGRFEDAGLNSADPYFSLMESGRSYRRSVAGLRLNVTPKAALKAEWVRTTEDGTAGAPSTLSLQYSVRF